MLCTKVKQPSVRARFKEQGSAPSLSELATAAGLGDSRAAAALWARCSVVATQVARCWANDSAEAEDLSQEALLRVVESFSALRDPAAVVGWLRVIVQRSVTRGARSVRRGRPLFAGGGDPEMLPSPRDPRRSARGRAALLVVAARGRPAHRRNCEGDDAVTLDYSTQAARRRAPARQTTAPLSSVKHSKKATSSANASARYSVVNA
jgi:DNA-directed RNA polymerase specialized sigma24 family protein